MPTDNVQKVITKTNYSITFTTAFAMKFIEKTLTCTATSGEFFGEDLRVYQSGIGASVYGMRIWAYSQALTTGVAWLTGIDVACKVDSARYVASGIAAGMFKVKAESDSVITTGAWILWLINAVKCTPGELPSWSAIRISAESGTEPLDSYMLGHARATYFLRGPEGALKGKPWNSEGTPGTQAGWIKVHVDGEIRWIQLFSVAP